MENKIKKIWVHEAYKQVGTSNWTVREQDEKPPRPTAYPNDWEGYVSLSALESANAEIAALKNHLELMTANRDAYAKAMGIAMEEGIFPHKEITKAKIAEALKQFLKEAGDGK